jgi:Spy/CpxP family protein refolding chaperone
MPTRNLKLILIAASILALGAGVFAGMAVSRMPITSAQANDNVQAAVADHLSIADELHLSDTQRDQMRKIWEKVRYTARDTYSQAQEIQKDRDAAILAMLSDSQKAQYAALTQQAAEKFAKLSTERQQAFQEGVQATQTILSDSQRATYNRIIQDRLGSGVGGPAAAASVPTTQAGDTLNAH